MKVVKFIKYLWHYRAINGGKMYGHIDVAGWHWEEKYEYWDTPHCAEKSECPTWE